MNSITPLFVKTAVIVMGVVICLGMPVRMFSADIPQLQTSFMNFLSIYIKEIKQGNAGYLETVHPNLPADMHEFFIDITLDMMKYAGNEGIAPDITCREYDICKVTWPQPGDSWAAQTFVRHEGKWQWLEY